MLQIEFLSSKKYFFFGLIFSFLSSFLLQFLFYFLQFFFLIFWWSRKLRYKIMDCIFILFLWHKVFFIEKDFFLHKIQKSLLHWSHFLVIFILYHALAYHHTKSCQHHNTNLFKILKWNLWSRIAACQSKVKGESEEVRKWSGSRTILWWRRLWCWWNKEGEVT